MKERFLLYFSKTIGIIVILLAICVITFTNHLANLGGRLRSIELETQQVMSENEDLRLAIASASSLSSVGVRAVQLGFVRPQQIFTFNETVYSIALRISR